VGGIREGNWQFPKLRELRVLVAAAAAAALVVVVVVLRRFVLCSSLPFAQSLLCYLPFFYGFFTI
jgi:hypothetical protein